jgi:hypothetical protein
VTILQSCVYSVMFDEYDKELLLPLFLLKVSGLVS